MPTQQLKKLKIKSVMFVGGKNRNLPAMSDDITHVHHWEQTGHHKGMGSYSTPYPLPDLIIIFSQWASHQLVEKGEQFANSLNIPFVTVSSGMSQAIKRLEVMGLDATHIFTPTKKTQKTIKGSKMSLKPKRSKIARKMIGEFKEKVLNIAEEYRLWDCPLKEDDARQLKELIMLKLNERVEVPSLQRLMRLNTSPQAKDAQERIKTREKDIKSITSPTNTPEPQKPKEISTPQPKFTKDMASIFQQILDMHREILNQKDELNEAFKEIEKLHEENIVLRAKAERYDNIKAQLETA